MTKQAVMRIMSAACSGVGYTNVPAIKNRMSRYDKDGAYISPVTGVAGLVVTEKISLGVVTMLISMFTRKKAKGE